jgi:acyl phosphate:glycerol-3-phosphate acyltransferase
MSRTRDLAACGAGYVLGSVPVGVWLGKAARNIDVREHGSGGTGTTNVLRTVGPAAAGAVFVLDVAKGSAAVGVARALGCDAGAQAAAGVAAMVGHSWPVLARFRGGKGVATAFGSLLMLSPEGSASAVVGGLGMLAASRIVSVGSLAAATSASLGATVAAVTRRRPGTRAALGFTLAGTGLIYYRHAANIRRLLAGTEPRVSLDRRAQEGATGAGGHGSDAAFPQGAGDAAARDERVAPLIPTSRAVSQT